MNPLSLPGPEFLALWIFGAIAVALVTALVRRTIAGPRPSPGEVDALAAGLYPTELAYLADGIGRAVEAAIAGLVKSGALVADDGGLRVVDTAPRLYSDGTYRGYVDGAGLSSAERYVLGELRRAPAMPVGLLISGAGALDAELAGRLRSAGLLMPEGPGAGLQVRAPGLAWLGLGVAKLCVGLSRHRPVGVLVVLLAFAVFALIKLSPPRRTARGDAVVGWWTELSHGLRVTAQTAPDQLSGSDAALAYALFGSVTVSAVLAAQLPSHQAALAAAATSSSGGSSCGSSCGGGCGGGCGGCS